MSATPQATGKPRKQAPAWAAVGLAVAFCLFGIGMSIWGVIAGLQARAFSEPVPRGIQTTGTVVDVLSHTSRGTTYRAVIRFTDIHGQAHTFKGQEGNEEPKTGERAQVSYDPNRPVEAHDLTFNHGSWRWPFWTGIIIGTVSLVGLVTVVVLWVRRSGSASASENAAAHMPADSVPPTQAVEPGGLSPVEKGRLIGLWLLPPVAWVVFPLVGLSLAAPIAITVVALLGTVAVMSKGRESHDGE